MSRQFFREMECDSEDEESEESGYIESLYLSIYNNSISLFMHVSTIITIF